MTVQQNRKIKRAALGICGIGLFAIVANWLPVMRRIEQISLDFRYANRNRLTQSSDQVVFVDIDEQSLKLLEPYYGRWPWPRRVYKELISFLALGNPKAILFDILFTEKMLNSNEDRVLAEVTRAVGNVSHGMHFLEDRAEEGEGLTPLPEGFEKKFSLEWKKKPLDLERNTKRYFDFAVPAKDYLSRIPSVHVVTAEKDPDGVLRRVPMVFNYGNVWFPSLALKGLMALLEKPQLEVEDERLVLSDGSQKRFEIPLDKTGNLALHFYRPSRAPRKVPMVSAVASAMVLEKGTDIDPALLQLNPLELEGKLIIVGGSAVGLDDLKATPVSASYPGSQLWATAISNVLQGEYLYRVPSAWQWLVVIMIATGIYAAIFFLENIFLQAALPTVLVLGYLAVSLVLFRSFGVWLEIAVPIGAGIFAIMDAFAFQTFVETAGRRRVEGTLSKYVSPSVTKILLSQGSDPHSEVGRLEEISILFSDIRGFTSLSEKYPPDIIVRRLNEYLRDMTEVIFSFEGTLDKFIGDAVMAFWGAPLRDEHHPLRAIRAALAMQAAVERLNETWARETEEKLVLRVGVGIHTGTAIVGNIGSDKRLDYTIIGDNVNLASRIEGLTKLYGVGIAISDSTHQKIKDKICCRLIENQIQVKGKSEGTKLFEPLGEWDALETRRKKALFEGFDDAIHLYSIGEFQKAFEIFDTISKRNEGKDPVSILYLERCLDLVKNPPEKWSGVYVAKSK